MAIVQKIEFKNSNRYCCWVFYKYAINSSGIKGSVEFKSETITV